MIRNSKGVTLIELMVVLVVMGVMTAMAIPMLGITPHAKLKSAARDIVSTLKSVHLNALRDGIKWRMVFDAANKQYRVYSFDPTQTDTTKQYVLKKTSPLYEGSTAARFAFGSGYGIAPLPSSETAAELNCVDMGEICFWSSGVLGDCVSAKNTKKCGVYIMDTKTNNTIHIAVAITGRVHMQTNIGKGWTE